MNGTLTKLRDIVPIRALTVTESFELAERQADLLLSFAGIDTPPVPETVITDVPRVEVERITPSPVFGAAQWSRGRWLILIRGADSTTRQRFTLAHEFKHILDHPFIDVLYPSVCTMTTEQRAEAVCDYFAACLLMPRRWLVRECASAGPDPGRLARRFDVSHTAMQVRLQAVGFDRSHSRYRRKRKEADHDEIATPRRRCDPRPALTRS
jgi:predicted transcriptional regulator